MRISTSMIFDAGVSTINNQSATLLHLQQQVSTGRRIVSPSDDPIAAARALEVTQSKDITAQYGVNQNSASSALGLEESHLSDTGDLLTRIRELAVQAGNGTLSANDRHSIATELRARYDELLGIANATDGSGQYLFSGYSASVKPFGGTVDYLLAAPGNEILYQGDEGQQRIQVSASRQLEVGDPGSTVFQRIKNGNGYFVTGYNTANTGTGVIDTGSVTNPATWNALTNKNYSIVFASDASTTPPTTRYDILDNAGDSLLVTHPPAGAAPLASQRVYQSGQPIVLTSQGAEPAFDLGGTISISGAPAAGDTFTLGPSTSQSLFKTLANLIGAIEGANTATSAGAAQYSNALGQALANLDQAHDNILQVRAAIGARLNEVESLGNANSDLNLQYEQTLSQLQDVDYAKAISDLTRKQTDLQAAQKSFVSTSDLSLFKYL